MPEIQSLTALRGFAAIWIILHHFWPQTNSPSPFLIAKGYLAVDLFFILSGLVLYLVYAEMLRTGQFDYRRFILKRFARLYPVHFATLILATLVLEIGPQLGFAGQARSYDLGQMFVLHASLLHAWGITETGGLNYPSWSLSAEAFAYALFPALALIVINARFALGYGLLFLVLAVLGTQIFWPDTLRNLNDNLVFTRLENDWGILRIIPEFALGLAIAKHTQTDARRIPWLPAGLFMIPVGFHLNFDIIVVLGFAAILGAAVNFNPKTPLFLRSLGELSYSIYMTHALVQIIGFKLIEHLFGFADREVPVGFIIPLLILTMLCARGMHLWCEQPARRMILGFSKPKSVAPKVPRSFPT